MDYDDQLRELFYPGESPYMNMYVAGLKGIPLEAITSYLQLIGVGIRQKDVDQWSRGSMKHVSFSSSMKNSINPMPARTNIQITPKAKEIKFSDLKEFPANWNPPIKRFFPCSKENKPLVKWGWKKGDQSPDLYDYETAKSLSPCGWIGQNMLYQRYIVIDIDGVGHGTIDQATINFGNMFKYSTLTTEDPEKRGSFHLYFRTNKIIPIKHFPHAKIDLMGNAVNAAVYFKNKQSNHLKMMDLTEEIWDTLMTYQKSRKEVNYV